MPAEPCPAGRDEETINKNKRRKLSVWVSYRFRHFGNTAERFCGDETISFSFFPVSCRKLLFADMVSYLNVHETPYETLIKLT